MILTTESQKLFQITFFQEDVHAKVCNVSSSKIAELCQLLVPHIEELGSMLSTIKNLKFLFVKHLV